MYSTRYIALNKVGFLWLDFKMAASLNILGPNVLGRPFDCMHAPGIRGLRKTLCLLKKMVGVTCRVYDCNTQPHVRTFVLPFIFIEAVAFQNSYYGEGEKLAMSLKFNCKDEESSLLECKYKTYNDIEDRKCGGETAGVQCSHCKFT